MPHAQRGCSQKRCHPVKRASDCCLYQAGQAVCKEKTVPRLRDRASLPRAAGVLLAKQCFKLKVYFNRTSTQREKVTAVPFRNTLAAKTSATFCSALLWTCSIHSLPSTCCTTLKTSAVIHPSLLCRDGVINLLFQTTHKLSGNKLLIFKNKYSYFPTVLKTVDFVCPNTTALFKFYFPCTLHRKKKGRGVKEAAWDELDLEHQYSKRDLFNTSPCSFHWSTPSNSACLLNCLFLRKEKLT